MSKQNIIKQLDKIAIKLNNIRIDINKYNSVGKQFDFVNSPALANNTGRVYKQARDIYKTVFQEL